MLTDVTLTQIENDFRTTLMAMREYKTNQRTNGPVNAHLTIGQVYPQQSELLPDRPITTWEL